MKVVAFGEALFRLSTQRGERFPDAHLMDFHLGGSELNICANLVSLGLEAEWVSALPEGKTGDLMREKIRYLGIDVPHATAIKNGRPGWYLMETGAAPRPDHVFGRFASSFADQRAFKFKWNEILNGAAIFHTSGIAAGLSRTLTSEVKKAMKAARALEIPVSYDFNFRKNVWTLEESIKRQKPLLPYIDILFCAQSDLDLFFGKKTSVKSIFSQTAAQMIVLCERNPEETTYNLKVLTRKGTFTSAAHRIQLIDRIGVGDSMAAAFLASWSMHKDVQKAAEWGAVAGALKYGIKGDMALLKTHEIESLLSQGYRGISR
ncbi:MAG: sugar kinase [Bacteriovoracaceae bacterium]